MEGLGLGVLQIGLWASDECLELGVLNRPFLRNPAAKILQYAE